MFSFKVKVRLGSRIGQVRFKIRLGSRFGLVQNQGLVKFKIKVRSGTRSRLGQVQDQD